MGKRRKTHSAPANSKNGRKGVLNFNKFTRGRTETLLRKADALYQGYVHENVEAAVCVLVKSGDRDVLYVSDRDQGWPFDLEKAADVIIDSSQIGGDDVIGNALRQMSRGKESDAEHDEDSEGDDGSPDGEDVVLSPLFDKSLTLQPDSKTPQFEARTGASEAARRTGSRSSSGFTGRSNLTFPEAPTNGSNKGLGLFSGFIKDSAPSSLAEQAPATAPGCHELSNATSDSFDLSSSFFQSPGSRNGTVSSHFEPNNSSTFTSMFPSNDGHPQLPQPAVNAAAHEDFSETPNFSKLGFHYPSALNLASPRTKQPFHQTQSGTPNRANAGSSPHVGASRPGFVGVPALSKGGARKRRVNLKNDTSTIDWNI